MRHQRARVRLVCQYPEIAWWRLADLTACSEQLFVQSTANWVVMTLAGIRRCCSLETASLLMVTLRG
jgi:hypothetical protein